MLFDFLLTDSPILFSFLFLIGLSGLVSGRKNIIPMLTSIEPLPSAVNSNLLFISVYLDDPIGQIFASLISTVAASEASIGLAISVIHLRIRGTILVQFIHFIKG